MGLYHVENSLYLGGGVDGSYPNYKYFSKFVKVLSDGELDDGLLEVIGFTSASLVSLLPFFKS